MDDEIRYYDRIDGKPGKIKSTPETRKKARRIHARFWLKRCEARGFMRSDMGYAEEACRGTGLNFTKEIKDLYDKRELSIV